MKPYFICEFMIVAILRKKIVSYFNVERLEYLCTQDWETPHTRDSDSEKFQLITIAL